MASDLERLARLRAKIAMIPQSAGVYLHKDAHGKIIYVGKAKNLQKRLKSYFTRIEAHSPKTHALVLKIEDFEIVLSQNEHEALILENNLIKHHRPHYNILLRDDKTFPYLKLSMQEEWPRLLTTRQRKNDGAIYFGPYSNSGQMYQLLSFFNRFFPLVRCTPQQFSSAIRPCNYYDIKRCLGPCKLPVSKQDYKGMLDSIQNILSGKIATVVAQLSTEMASSADKLLFERAAILRDQIHALQQLSISQSVSLSVDLNMDVIGSYWHKETVCFHVVSVRNGKVVGNQNYVVKVTVEAVDDDERVQGDSFLRAKTLQSFITQYYQTHHPAPWIWAIAGETILNADDRLLIEGYVRAAAQPVKALANSKLVSENKIQFVWEDVDVWNKHPKRSLCKADVKALGNLAKMSIENAKNHYQDKLMLDEKSRRLMGQLQDILQLQQLPMWIECFDISTFQGTETVASQVVFREGLPFKSDYRRYVIRDVPGQDDFGSLREVMRRRFGGEGRFQLPNLLIIDGGEPQLREVGRVLKTLGLQHISCVGLAKSRTVSEYRSAHVRTSEERLVIPAKSDGVWDPELPPKTLALVKGSPAYQLVTQMRDEAHRFAISLHRKRRDKLGYNSALSGISGLGPKRRKLLLSVFGSISAIRDAEVADLCIRGRLPERLAHLVKQTLNKQIPA